MRRLLTGTRSFARYRAAVDWPSCHFWRELAAFWPEAKVILTVRPEEKWWRSFCETIKITMDVRDYLPDPYRRGAATTAYRIISEQTFRAPMDAEQAALAAIRRRAAEVKAEIPPDWLLVFDVAEGWGPLCRFLGVPVPAAPFPHSNSTDDFWKIDRTRR